MPTPIFLPTTTCKPSDIPLTAVTDNGRKPSYFPTDISTYESHFPSSSLPTFAPSVLPSLSLKSEYLSKLSKLLQSPTSNQFPLQLQYFDLSVAGQHLYGSCSSWISFIKSDLALSQYDNDPQLLNLTTVGAFTTDFVVRSVTCQDAAAISKVLSLLTTFSAGRVMCGNRQWVVNVCSGFTAALCTDCRDPCQQSNDTKVITISPCGSDFSDRIQVFSVSYSNKVVAPSIKSLDMTASNLSIQIVASLSSTGTLHCGVFSAMHFAAVSYYDILHQNYNSETDKYNTSTVEVIGLLPSTSYAVYCYTYFAGATSTSSDLVKYRRFVNTTCCKTIKIERSTGSLFSGSDTSRFLSIRLNGLPSSSVSIVLSLSNKVTAFYPSKITFSAASSSDVYASVRSLPEGTYSYNVELSGLSAREFSISYITGSQFEVIGNDQPPPPPSISSITFSNDGAYLIVTFNSPTNRGNMTTTFECGNLFNFACASTSLCQWINDTTAFAYIKGKSCAVPNNEFGVRHNATIRPACQAMKPCSSWPKALPTLVAIRRPVVPVQPNVIISAPVVIGSCDNLTIDLSRSYGNGGRSWSQLTIKVFSAENNATMILQQFLDSNFKMEPPSAIPYSLIAKGYSYTFTVTLCNFLSACSSSIVSLVAADLSIPTLSMPGGPLRLINRNSLLSLSTSVSLSNCGSQNFAYTFSYQWILYRSGAPILSITSISKDPSKYILPPYSLQANTMYTVKVIASISGTSRSSYYSVNVLVGSGGLHIVIAGGLVRFVRVGSSIILDATSSFDDDQPGEVGRNAGLLYHWSCQQLSPFFNETCGGIFKLSSSEFSNIQLFALKTSSGYTGQVSLVITDAYGNRATQALIFVSVLESLAPLVSVQSNINTAKLNPGQQLQLTGRIQVASVINTSSATWSIIDNSISLSTIAASPATFLIFQASSIAYLIIPPFQLLGGSTLLLSLSCRSSDMYETIAYITIVVNSPPKSGYLQVQPSSGIELQTKFLFFNFLWTDDDLPLEYQMGYVSSNLMIVLQPKSESASSSSLLPAGEDSENNILQCYSQVYDALNANTSAFVGTTVSRGSSSFSLDFKSNLLKSKNVSGMSLNDVRKSNALASYVLNFINCTSAPNCTVLHRHSCQRTINTCGSCISAEFIGQSGDSNTLCYRPLTTFRKTCTVSVQCLVGQICYNGFCVAPLQSCPNDCSGHGTCNYVDVESGDPIVDCRIDNNNCKSICSCDEDFGGVSCSLSIAEFEATRALRSQLIDDVFYQISRDDSSEDAVNSWIVSITGAAQNPSELDSSSAAQVLETNNLIIAQASGLNLPRDSFSVLLTSVNSVSSAPTKVTTSTLLLNTIDLIASTIASASVPGQNAYTSVYPSFKVAVFAPDNTQASILQLSLPAAESDIHRDIKPSSIELPGLENGNLKNSKISIISLNSQFYSGGADFISHPISVHHSNLPCQEKTCNVTIILSNAMKLPAAIMSNESVSVFCKTGVRHVSNHTCKNGNYFLDTSCDGVLSGKVTYYCPAKHFASACSNLDPHSSGDASLLPTCHFVNATASATICSCQLQTEVIKSDHRSAAKTRRLQEASPSALNSSSGSMTVTAVTSAIIDSATKTVLSAADLNAAVIAKEWTVLATLGTFIVIAIGLMIWGNYLDRQVNFRTQMVKSKLDAVDKDVRRRRLLSPTSSRSIDATIEKEIVRLEDSLPAVLSSKSFMRRFLAEIRRHHRWFQVLFRYSPSFPRSLRVLSLATNIIIMLFVQSIIYNVSNPDDGSCATYRSQAACQQPRSSFGSGGSKCKWTPSDSSCSFIEPTEDITVVIFVAILSAVLTTPFAILEGVIIQKILAAPTTHGDVQHGNDEKRSKAFSLFSWKRSEDDEKYSALAKIDLARMIASLKRFRESIPDSQRRDFDGLKLYF